MQTYRDHGLVLRGLRHGGSRFASSVFVEGMSLASQLLLFSQYALDTLAAAREGHVDVRLVHRRSSAQRVTRQRLRRLKLSRASSRR